MSDSLKLPLGIDFSTFDTHMKKVADRIESVGKGASVKVGNAAGDLASGKLDPAKIKDLVTAVGMRLSSGMADGVRKSSSVMLGFGASIQKMLDKLAGSAVTIFQRMDDAMKFPSLDHSLRSAQGKLSNLSSLGGKPFSKFDLAIAGTSDLVQQMAGAIKAVIEVLADQIAISLKGAIASVVAEFAKIGPTAKNAESGVDELFKTANKAAAATSSAGSGGLPPRNQVAGHGRRIGIGTQFTSPPPPVTPTYGMGDARRGPIAGGGPEAIAAMTALGEAGSTTGMILGKVAAASGSLFLRFTARVFEVRNALRGAGDVGKASFHKMYESHSYLRIALLDTPLAIAEIGLKLLSLPFGVFRKGKQGADEMTKGVNATAQASQGLREKIRAIGGEVIMAVGAVGIVFKVVEFLKDGVKGASDLNETVSRTKVVFGEAFGPVSKQADELSSKFGLAHVATLNMASGFGAMAQGAGMSEEASASLAIQMTKMAADLASSVNIPFEEAGEKIRSALAGEDRPLREFGANISEDAVKLQMMRSAATATGNAIAALASKTRGAGMNLPDVVHKAGTVAGDVERARHASALKQAEGMVRAAGEREAHAVRLASIKSAKAAQQSPLIPRAATAKSVTGATAAIGEQAKMAARAALVMRGLGYAQGDLERTSDSAANQFRRAGGGMTEFATRIGTILLPAVNLITTAFNNALGVVLEWFDKNSAKVASWGAKFMEVVNGVGSILWQLATTVGSTIGSLFPQLFGQAIAGAQSVGEAFVAFVDKAISGIASVANNFGLYWKLIQLSAQQAIMNVGAIINTLPENFSRVTTWMAVNWWNYMASMVKMATDTFMNISMNAVSFGQSFISAVTGNGFQFNWTPMLEGFQTTVEQFPELMKPVWADMGKEMGDVWDQIAANDAARAQAIAKAGPAGPKKPGALTDQKTSEYKLAGASEIGSKEAYSVIARSQVGNQSMNSVVKAGVEAQKQSAATLKNIEKNTGAGKTEVQVK